MTKYYSSTWTVYVLFLGIFAGVWLVFAFQKNDFGGQWSGLIYIIFALIFLFINPSKTQKELQFKRGLSSLK